MDVLTYVYPCVQVGVIVCGRLFFSCPFLAGTEVENKEKKFMAKVKTI